MLHRTPLTRERLYPPYKIAALARLLQQDGVPVEATLHGTGLQAAALQDTGTRTSIEQYLVACRNAIRLSQDPALPFRLGAALRLADYGVYGLLLLCCGSARDYFGLAVRYQLLATPTVALDAEQGDRQALWVLPEEAQRELPDDLRTFLVEQEAARQVAHLQDALRAPCPPAMACFAHPAPAHRALYDQYLQCPCAFERPRTEIRYPKELLAQRPGLANPLSAAMLQSACDGQVADIEASLGFAGKVYRTLRHLRDPGAGMKAVAAALKMTDRTLRRRLADEGTSFSAISRHVKYNVATQQLKGSGASIDQIAAMAGFSDPANFRRAFLRWTRMTPAQFRRQQHR
jgi:AraC-like DNA-binding protein